MAHLLYLYNDTSGDSFVLTTTNSMLVNYTPQASEPVVDGARYGDREGEWIGQVFYPNVTETVELYIYATAKSTLQARTRDIERFLALAAQRTARKVGDRIFLMLQVDGESDIWRSEITSGRLELAQNALALWPNIGYEARLFITRRPYWERWGTAVNHDPMAVELAAYGQAASTSARTVTNTTGQNYVRIDEADSALSLCTIPTPVKLKVTNNSAGAQTISQIWVTHNAVASTLDVWLDASDLAAGYSMSHSGAGSIKFDLPAALLDGCAGTHARVLAYCNSVTGATRSQAVVGFDVGVFSSLYYGPQVEIATSSTEIVDLGLLPIPPGGTTSGWLDDETQIRITTTGSLNLHHLEVIPVTGERRWATPNGISGISMPATDGIIDDPIENEAYWLDGATGKKTPYVMTSGRPIMLLPDANQSLLFGWLGWTGTGYVTTYTAGVQAWMRPRRLTI